jgi:SAM-dependent MidA family methyltransferase
MTALSNTIREIIAHEGPISIERFMALALSHPQYGYYMAAEPFGAGGDFVTAPEISQMFGELLGLWSAEIWRMLGSPGRVHLVELGPGRGTLMADVLRAARVLPEFVAALDVHLVETSERLAARQSETLRAANVPVNWHKTIESLPPGPAIILANEFFDALPVRHYVRMANGWSERLVGLDAQGDLTFGVSGEIEPYIAVEAPVGSVLEINAAAQRVMTALAARVLSQGGIVLAIDYGHTETSLGETLQAVRHHAFVDPLRDVGEADLTAHVDFAALGRAARATGAAVHGPIAQGELLDRLGIFQRAEALHAKAGPQDQQAIAEALRRLVAPEPVSGPGAAMGSLFKAIAVTRKDFGAVPGFENETATGARI